MSSPQTPRMDCAIDATMSVIEGRWKTVILCKLANKGTLRFSQLMSELDKVSPRILTKQLRELEKDGLIRREVFAEVPVRVEYSLTPKGQSLGPALKSLADWGLKNAFNKVSIESVDAKNTHDQDRASILTDKTQQ